MNSSDTESADINAASTATTATTAAISEQQHLATKENNCNGKKSKGLVLFNAIFKRVHGLYGEKRRDANDAEQTRDTLETNAAALAADDNGSALQQTSVEGAVLVIDNEHNNAKNTKTTKNKEDKQLVYAELILKPSGTGDELSTKAPLKTTTTTNIKPTTATTATIAPESAGVTGKSATEYAEIVYVQKPNAEQSKQAV